MERKERIYELILEMKVGAETRDLDRVRTANEEFSQLCNIEFQGQEYLVGEFASNCDRARNNYLNSFMEDLPTMPNLHQQFLEEANKYFSLIEKEL